MQFIKENTVIQKMIHALLRALKKKTQTMAKSGTGVY